MIFLPHSYIMLYLSSLHFPLSCFLIVHTRHCHFNKLTGYPLHTITGKVLACLYFSSGFWFGRRHNCYLNLSATFGMQITSSRHSSIKIQNQLGSWDPSIFLYLVLPTKKFTSTTYSAEI